MRPNFYTTFSQVIGMIDELGLKKKSGNFNFVLKTNPDEEAESYHQAITNIKENLPVFTTRAIRHEFVNRYAKVGTKPTILRLQVQIL